MFWMIEARDYFWFSSIRRAKEEFSFFWTRALALVLAFSEVSKVSFVLWFDFMFYFPLFWYP